MTQEEKELLLKDLCGRLPYGVKVELHDEVCTLLGYFADFVMLTSNTPMGQQTNIANIKPYLRPMSSMTEEEEKEVNKLLGYRKNINDYGSILCSGWNGDVIVNIDVIVSYLNWLNAHHFDYRGLIEMGLALEAPEEMYK